MTCSKIKGKDGKAIVADMCKTDGSIPIYATRDCVCVCVCDEMCRLVDRSASMRWLWVIVEMSLVSWSPNLGMLENIWLVVA